MLKDEDIAAIKKSYDIFLKGKLYGNWDEFAKFYTEDAIMMPPNQPEIRGREAIVAFAKSVGTAIHFQPDIRHIDGSDDLAYVRGTYSVTMEPKGGTEPIHDEGKFPEIRCRQSDGSWACAVDIWSSDLRALE